MSTKLDKAKPKQKKNIFSNIFRSSIIHPEYIVNPGPIVNSQVPFLLLELPRSVRVKIWKLLGFSHTKNLRLVCSVIKEDIDQFTGISSAIDSTYDDFPFHCNIAIRKVAIHELIVPTYIAFLKYPLILQELEIRGEISLQNFQYILKSCPNISKLLIIFNKFVLDYKTQFFPIPVESGSPKPLSKLRSLKLISTTKKLSEMMYAYRMLVSLLRDTLSDTKIHSLHLWVTHKASSVYFKEIMWTALVFVQKNCSTLRYLSLTFRDKDQLPTATDGTDKSTGRESGDNSTNVANSSQLQSSENSKSGESKPEVPSKVEKQQSNISAGRRDTEAITIPLPPGVVITHHVKDIHSEDASAAAASATPSAEGEGEADVDVSKTEESSEETNNGIVEATRYLKQNAWPKANNLEQLWLTAPLRCMQEILNMMSPNTKLQVLQLEMVGGGGQQSNWKLYKQYIQLGNPKTLKFVTFCAVNHVDSAGHSLPIDLGVFRKSKGLRKLSILCQKKDDFSRLSRAQGVSRLPNKLNEVNFERLLLTPCQVNRLLVCFPEMLGVSVAYWSINDCQFSMLMKLIKWSVRLDLIDVPKISLVDTKLRFKNNRKAVRNLQEAVSVSVRYQDLNETRLTIEVSQKQDNRTFAPRISLFKKKEEKQIRRKGKNKDADVSDISSLSSQQPV